MNFRQNAGNGPFLIVSWSIIVLGLSVCFGWCFDVPVMISVWPGLPSMKFNAALCFILSGAIFFLLITKRWPFTYLLLTTVLLLFGVLLSAENIFHYDFGIDQFFIKDTYSLASGLPFPGRPSTATTLCFSLLALTFFGLKSSNKTFRKIISYNLDIVLLVAFVALIGYLFNVPSLYKMIFVTSMALHTSIGMLLLSVSLIFFQSDMGIGKLFTGDSLGSIVARRLFLQMMVTILILGYLRLLSHRYHLVPVEFGIAIYSVSFIVVILILLWVNAKLLDQTDEKRKRAEHKVQLMNTNLEKTISERTAQLEQTNAELINSNERFFIIFNDNPVGMVISDLETTRFQYVNENFCKNLGYQKEDVVGKTSAEIELINPLQRKQVLSQLQNHGTVRGIEMLIRKMTGDTFWAIVSLQILEIGGKKFALTSFVDIEAQKMAEEKLKDSNELLSNLSKELVHKNSELVIASLSLKGKIDQLEGLNNIIAHNLRGPARNIKFLSEKSEIFSETESLGMIHESSQALLNELDVLMELAQINLNKDIQYEECDVAGIAKNIIAQLKGVIYQKQVTIVFDLNVKEVHYPKVYLESIMYNLISNAIKYSRTDIVPNITISTKNVNGKTQLVVKDNGLGINMEKYKDQVFKLNQTFHSGHDSKGVGLFITKTQIEASGGSIEVNSELNQGSEFIVTF
jgi:PAS domain S-box-containing protein